MLAWAAFLPIYCNGVLVYLNLFLLCMCDLVSTVCAFACFLWRISLVYTSFPYMWVPSDSWPFFAVYPFHCSHSLFFILLFSQTPPSLKASSVSPVVLRIPSAVASSSSGSNAFCTDPSHSRAGLQHNYCWIIGGGDGGAGFTLNIIDTCWQRVTGIWLGLR